MKKIYFVRHGESEGNSGPIRQGPDSPLTEKGKQQAAFIANRAKHLPIELVISSTMTRARETADIIVSAIDTPLEISSLFVERRHAQEEIGKPKDDGGAVEAGKTIQENFHIPEFRFSDEENFEDLKSRVEEALELLKGRKEENILVVTHGFFMRIVMAYVTLGDELTGEQCKQFIRVFHMENTGLTILGCDTTKESPWWLWTWNDHAHLG